MSENTDLKEIYQVFEKWRSNNIGKETIEDYRAWLKYAYREGIRSKYKHK